MARSTFARMGTMVVLAVSTLGACDRTPTGTTADVVVPMNASLARGSNNGGGKGGSAAVDQPTMAMSPAQLTLVVGQKFAVAVTYWDNRGNIIPVTDDKPTYYGCRKLLDTDPDCWSVVSIVPGGTNNREAMVTGKAAGSVQVYATDGLGTWVTSIVTVQ
jgi:hypothetical protein